MTEYEGAYLCDECGTGWLTITAADECSLLCSIESKQIRAHEKKRKPWDSGIVRSNN